MKPSFSVVKYYGQCSCIILIIFSGDTPCQLMPLSVSVPSVFCVPSAAVGEGELVCSLSFLKQFFCSLAFLFFFFQPPSFSPFRECSRLTFKIKKIVFYHSISAS